MNSAQLVVTESDYAHQQWLMRASLYGSNHWVSNTQANYRSLDLLETPVALAQSQAGGQPQSYVHCPRSAWLDYPIAESARQLSGYGLTLARAATATFSPALAQLLKQSGLMQAITINNFLISTNLYPAQFAGQIAQITHKLSQNASSPLLIRNICAELDPQLHANLLDTGWDLIPARQVYLCKTDQFELNQHNHVRKDAKLLTAQALAQDQLELLSAGELTKADLPRLLDLYQQLFLQKYSGLNPNFSLNFLEFCLTSGFLELFALRHKHNFLGVLGIYSRSGNNWLTTPLLGYQLPANQQFSLYRRLMALLLQQAQQKNLHLHYSSGAGHFKRLRGGKPALEYSAVFSAHLPASKRLAIKTWAGLLKTAVPFVLKHSKA